MDVSFLDHGGERLLGRPPRLQEGRKIASLAQPRDAQLDRARPGLPVPVAVTVALHPAALATRAVRGPAPLLGLQLHQALGGEADHLVAQ